ncbi:AI-2E family transporter [Catellatospora methionotrophica]|uniref:AI-2E family transporter n=1 Tax=Catellatospora methionotrophica TaxID=121620 RepID=A0A8J3LEA9_9ACTN|nr:AI-2E family transporter [Catellatospora methionotrophica]GIG17662.1 AI-2E family transporter [Catellatospora methionotrophica]
MGRLDNFKANVRRAYEASRASARAKREQDEREREDAGAPLPEPVEPELQHYSTASRDDVDVPYSLRIGAAWAWRIIVLGFLLVYLLQFLGKISIVIVPVLIAMLLAALLGPAVRWLNHIRVHRSLATAIVVLVGLAAVAGTLTLVINQFVNGLPDLTKNAAEGIQQIQTWLKNGPLHLTDAQLGSAIDSVTKSITTNKEALTTGAITTATTVFEVLSGLFLVIFTLFFFLRDGRVIWRFLLRLVPNQAREPLDRAGLAAWGSLGAYVRATVLVAFIDAVGIGIALALLRVPFALPLAALVFLGAFIPIVGATLSGAVAVLVALVTNGPLTALLVLAAVIAIQQIEGHLLQPLIMGRAVAIHPLAVILGIAAGVVLAGIVGALIAVPLIAILNTAIRSLAGRPQPEPDSVIVKAPPAPAA